MLLAASAQTATIMCSPPCGGAPLRRSSSAMCPAFSPSMPAQVAALTVDDLPVAVRVSSTQAALQQAAAAIAPLSTWTWWPSPAAWARPRPKRPLPRWSVGAHDAQERGQCQQRDRPAADAAGRSTPPINCAVLEMGMYALRRDRAVVRIGAPAHRRGDQRAAGASGAAGQHRAHRPGQSRAGGRPAARWRGRAERRRSARGRHGRAVRGRQHHGGLGRGEPGASGSGRDRWGWRAAASSWR